ncbi:MAG: glycosyltransferase family 2 protein, partial [bacterium]|nr:glycosyltransferase family 2 protein [bacterium]
PISVVVITLNEGRNLARCLSAADFCSEIIVVDSGSTDESLAIAERFGARIFHRPWSGYRDQKNFGVEQASQPWVLCIDADEVVSAELKAAILRRFAEVPPFDAFAINRHGYYADRLIWHSGWYPQWRLFLYRKGQAIWSGDEPHTVVDFRGVRSARLEGDLYHYTYATISEHIRKSLRAAEDAAEAMFQKQRPASVSDLVFRPVWATFKTYVLQAGFLDGFYGVVIAVGSGYYTFLKYALLHEKHRRRFRSIEAESSGRA